MGDLEVNETLVFRSLGANAPNPLAGDGARPLHSSDLAICELRGSLRSVGLR
jgi:hypothetical protein